MSLPTKGSNVALDWADRVSGRPYFDVGELARFVSASDVTIPEVLAAGGWFRVEEGDRRGAERFIATPEPPGILRIRDLAKLVARKKDLEADVRKAFSALISVTLDGLSILVLPEVAHAMGLTNGQKIDRETYRAMLHQSLSLVTEMIRQEKLGAN